MTAKQAGELGIFNEGKYIKAKQLSDGNWELTDYAPLYKQRAEAKAQYEYEQKRKYDKEFDIQEKTKEIMKEKTPLLGEIFGATWSPELAKIQAQIRKSTEETEKWLEEKGNEGLKEIYAIKLPNGEIIINNPITPALAYTATRAGIGYASGIWDVASKPVQTTKDIGKLGLTLARDTYGGLKVIDPTGTSQKLETAITPWTYPKTSWEIGQEMGTQILKDPTMEIPRIAGQAKAIDIGIKGTGEIVKIGKKKIPSTIERTIRKGKYTIKDITESLKKKPVTKYELTTTEDALNLYKMQELIEKARKAPKKEITIEGVPKGEYKTEWGKDLKTEIRSAEAKAKWKPKETIEEQIARVEKEAEIRKLIDEIIREKTGTRRNIKRMIEEKGGSINPRQKTIQEIRETVKEQFKPEEIFKDKATREWDNAALEAEIKQRILEKDLASIRSETGSLYNIANIAGILNQYKSKVGEIQRPVITTKEIQKGMGKTEIGERTKSKSKTSELTQEIQKPIELIKEREATKIIPLKITEIKTKINEEPEVTETKKPREIITYEPKETEKGKIYYLPQEEPEEYLLQGYSPIVYWNEQPREIRELYETKQQALDRAIEIVDQTPFDTANAKPATGKEYKTPPNENQINKTKFYKDKFGRYVEKNEYRNDSPHEQKSNMFYELMKQRYA